MEYIDWHTKMSEISAQKRETRAVISTEREGLALIRATLADCNPVDIPTYARDMRVRSDNIQLAKLMLQALEKREQALTAEFQGQGQNGRHSTEAAVKCRDTVL